MIDIHCHILPGLDDGASTMEEARLMAAMAADDGVTDIVATPHLIWGDPELSARQDYIRKTAEELRMQLLEAGIPLSIHVGAEVLCCGAVPEYLTKEMFPCIEHTSYALVEFYFDEKPDYMNRWLATVRNGGITPIVAHPERYAAVQRDKQLTRLWRGEGCLLQLNKGSFAGQFGWRAKRAAHRLMDERLADFVASDAHNISGRTPRLAAVHSSLSKRYGAEYTEKLMRTHWGKLLI